MKAVILKNTGNVDQLHLEEVAKPDVNDHQILIKTKAFSINPIEVKTRKGNRFSEQLLKNPPAILGWDAAGIIEKTGAKIKNFKVGDHVFGIIGFPKFGKTYAEYIIAEEKDLVLIPQNIDFQSAAASNIAALTAFQALKYDAKLNKNSRILIHAASGGVGHFGVQIAKYFGAEIYATASDRNRNFVKNLGTNHFIDYKTEDFEQKVKNVDVVFDLIGGSYIDRSLNCLKKGGTIISIPSATNEAVEKKAKDKGCHGVRFIMKANQTDLKSVAQLLEQGHLKPHISKTWTIDNIRAAHQSLEDGHTRGKLVITLD